MPILPPNQRPIVRLRDNNVIVSEINYSYISIINTNNKIAKLKKMLIPEKFIKKEKNLMQVKVDELIGQGSSGRKYYKQKAMWKDCKYSTVSQKVKYIYIFLSKKIHVHFKQDKKISICKNISGKTGILRENILGKRVDYSARSVIIVEPKLKLNECGIPKDIKENQKLKKKTDQTSSKKKFLLPKKKYNQNLWSKKYFNQF